MTTKTQVTTVAAMCQSKHLQRLWVVSCFLKASLIDPQGEKWLKHPVLRKHTPDSKCQVGCPVQVSSLCCIGRASCGVVGKECRSQWSGAGYQWWHGLRRFFSMRGTHVPLAELFSGARGFLSPSSTGGWALFETALLLASAIASAGWHILSVMRHLLYLDYFKMKMKNYV